MDRDHNTSADHLEVSSAHCSQSLLREVNIVVITSTYPRWPGDAVPTFVADVCRRIAPFARALTVLAPHDNSAPRYERETSGVFVRRITYWLPRRNQTLFYYQSASNQATRHLSDSLKALTYCISIFASLLRHIRSTPLVLNPRWILPHAVLALPIRILVPQCRLITSVHGADIFQYNSWPLRFFKKLALKYSDEVIVNSPKTEAACYSLHRRSYHIIPSGFDSSVYYPPSPRRDPPKRPHSYNLITVGRLSPEKGITNIISALSLLTKGNGHLHLHIVGSGPAANSLREQVQTEDLQRYTTFHGWLDKHAIARLYHNSDVFVGASQIHSSGWQEAFGNVYAEALASGLPTIVPSSAGISQLLEHKKDALIIDSTHPDTIAASIKTIMHDDRLRARLSTNGPSTIRQYNLDATAARYADVIISTQQR